MSERVRHSVAIGGHWGGVPQPCDSGTGVVKLLRLHPPLLSAVVWRRLAPLLAESGHSMTAPDLRPLRAQGLVAARRGAAVAAAPDAEVPRLPEALYDVAVPAPTDWEPRVRGYLQLSPAYDDAAEQARQRGGTRRRCPGSILTCFPTRLRSLVQYSPCWRGKVTSCHSPVGDAALTTMAGASPPSGDESRPWGPSEASRRRPSTTHP